MVAWSSLTDHWLTVLGVTATAVLVTSAVFLYTRKPEVFVCVGHVSSLHGYPIKSCAGIDTDEAVCTATGLQVSGVLDRNFVIVRSDGDFITQRQVAKMAGVKTSVEGQELVLESSGMPELRVPVQPPLDRSKVVPCRVWDSKLEAQDCGTLAGQWLSDLLGEEGLKLLVLTQGLKLRGARCIKAKTKDKVPFQDRAPFLIATEKSLADLNSRMDQSQGGEITMKNFRPTIVIKGCPRPWDEDSWKRIKIGQNVYLRVLEPCGRCTLTTVDPDQMEKRQDGEPIKTLKQFRMFPKVHATAPLFATYAGLESAPGTIKVGDPVYVVRGEGFNTKIRLGV